MLALCSCEWFVLLSCACACDLLIFLFNLRSLTSLRLEGNSIGCAGCAALARGLGGVLALRVCLAADHIEQ